MNKIIAALVGLLLAVTGFSVASATEPTDEPCVPSEGTAWTDSGPEVKVHGDSTPPGTDTDTERWRFIASSKHIVQSATEDQEVFDYWQRYSWTGGPWDDSQGEPPFPDERWQPNVKGDPHGVGIEGAYFRSHGSSGKGDWFYLEAVTKVIPGQAEVSHVDYFWQKQVRTLPVNCPGEDTPVTPEPPVITPGDCDDLDGSVVAPVTEGITYEFTAQGLKATPNEGYDLDLTGTNYDWRGPYAVLDFEFPTPVDPASCEEPEEPENPGNPDKPEPKPPVTVVKKSPPAKVEVPTVVDSGL